MTLTTRLTLFFLSALGLVLSAFSITLYLLAHHHLHRQLHDRAAATLVVAPRGMSASSMKMIERGRL